MSPDVDPRARGADRRVARVRRRPRRDRGRRRRRARRPPARPDRRARGIRSRAPTRRSSSPSSGWAASTTCRASSPASTPTGSGSSSSSAEPGRPSRPARARSCSPSALAVGARPSRSRSPRSSASTFTSDGEFYVRNFARAGAAVPRRVLPGARGARLRRPIVVVAVPFVVGRARPQRLSVRTGRRDRSRSRRSTPSSHCGSSTGVAYATATWRSEPRPHGLHPLHRRVVRLLRADRSRRRRCSSR